MNVVKMFNHCLLYTLSVFSNKTKLVTEPLRSELHGAKYDSKRYFHIKHVLSIFTSMLVCTVNIPFFIIKERTLSNWFS